MPSSRKFCCSSYDLFRKSMTLFLRAEEFQDSIPLRPDTPQANRLCACWVHNSSIMYTFSVMTDSVIPSQHNHFVSLYKYRKDSMSVHASSQCSVRSYSPIGSHQRHHTIIPFQSWFFMGSSKKSKKRKRSSPVEEEIFAVGNPWFSIVQATKLLM